MATGSALCVRMMRQPLAEIGSDQAHDRVRRRDEVDRQIWQRVHPGEADNEQAAAGCQEPGVPALLVVVEIGVMVSESGSPGSAAAVFRWPG